MLQRCWLSAQEGCQRCSPWKPRIIQKCNRPNHVLLETRKTSVQLPRSSFWKCNDAILMSILSGGSEGGLCLSSLDYCFPSQGFLPQCLWRGGERKLNDEAAPMCLHVDLALCLVWESEALASGEPLVPSMSSTLSGSGRCLLSALHFTKVTFLHALQNPLSMISLIHQLLYQNVYM